MSLRHAVFACRIVWRTLDRPDLSLAPNAALELALHFGTRTVFERIWRYVMRPTDTPSF